MTDQEYQIMCILGIVGVIIGIVYVCFQQWVIKSVKKGLAEDDIKHCTRITEHAKIVEKIPSQSVLGIAVPCQLMFENTQGHRKTFAIKDVVLYSQSLIGDEGELTYAGQAFVKFDREKR